MPNFSHFQERQLYVVSKLFEYLLNGSDQNIDTFGLYKVFVSADVITIIMQIAGAALVGVSESKLANGLASPLTPAQANDILLAGLAIQVCKDDDDPYRILYS